MLVPEKCLEINNKYISREIYGFLILRTVCNVSSRIKWEQKDYIALKLELKTKWFYAVLLLTPKDRAQFRKSL